MSSSFVDGRSASGGGGAGRSKSLPYSDAIRAAVRGAGGRAWESVPMAQHGVVKFFNGERGYGFIKPDDGGRDVFVHVTAVEQAGLKGLNEGQRISFEVEPDKKGKGPKAVNLVVNA